MEQPLAGLRVVELATGVPGPFAGKLLADFGAEVIKVEPVGGDPSRGVRLEPDHPLTSQPESRETSPLFLHLNANKRSIVADPAGSPADRTLIEALIAASDLVIESFAPGAMAGWGLAPALLQETNPALVVLSVTPWGQDGPYATLPGNELAIFALAGPMSSTGIDGREPMKMAGRTISYQAGTVAALAALAAIRRAEATGKGAIIDAAGVAAQLGSIDRRVSYLLYRQFSGQDAVRAPASAQHQLPAGVLAAGDGHVQVLTIANWIPGMVRTLGDAELQAAYAQADWGEDPDLPGVTEAAVYSWMLERTRNEVMVQAQANRWPITAINAPVDVLADPHFRQRGSFVEVDHPAAGRYQTIGAPWRVEDGWKLRRPAPLLDADRQDILAELARHPAGPGARTGPARAAAVDRLPLEGVRVLDLTVVWAGPYCTMLLGDLGAEVVRVDNPWVFPTATRGGSPRPPKALIPLLGPLGAYPDLDTGARPWNRHSMYCAHARNKQGVTLDLRTEVGRELFLRMVEVADVLVENNSAKVLDQLGIGWDVLHTRNPRLVAVRMAPLGLSGPYKDFIGFGVHFEGLCGATAIRGYRDADPSLTWPTFHMDPATGAAGALAVLAALRRRERTGVGELVEFAQAENMMQHLGEYYIDASLTGRRHLSPGNRDLQLAPQGCYLAGDGGYLVLTVETDEQWRGFATTIGAPELAGLGQGARLAAHDHLDEVLQQWAAGLSTPEAVDRCRTHGLAAAPVLGEGACLADEHLVARRALRANGSEDLGEFLFPDHLFRWDGPPLRWDPLCRMGADNATVYRRWLGCTDEELAALDQAGQLSEDYLQPDGTAF